MASISAQTIQLAVPYLSQRDSATSQGERMCFSSSCAMAAAFIKPGCLSGKGQADDHYLQLVQRYGDSTNAAAQVQALASLGIQAQFRTNGAGKALIQQLKSGIPCPVGWLHHGTAASPTGGGHWSLAVGWDPNAQQFLMHDPYGEADLVAGGFTCTAIGSGKGVRYSLRNWGARWQADGPGTGWWIQISR